MNDSEERELLREAYQILKEHQWTLNQECICCSFRAPWHDPDCSLNNFLNKLTERKIVPSSETKAD